ncbi:MAG TPA: DUF2232 domain-containing protein [Gemmatimonadales bacterium]|jgi:hypothetical protein|nr:DUF2232 domain-containing protein [Gemmatimonadales bacterium]
MDVAASPPGRRVSFGAAAALAGYLLLAPSLFVLAPFVLLTLLSRPRTLRELFWLIAAGLGLGLALRAPLQPGDDLVIAGALVLAAGFAALCLRARTGGFARALLAVALAAVAVVVWESVRGVSWAELHQGFTTALRQGYQAMGGQPGASSPQSPELKSLLQSLSDAAPELANALPGVLTLVGLAGLLLAWDWHHRIADRPLGPPPGPFRGFRFNDHLVWGAIFTLALLIAPLPSGVRVIAENLLIVWGGLYAMRGLAIVAALLGPAPISLRVLTAVVGLLLLPVALGVWLALGLADTWLDIRTRLASRASGGS